MKLSKKGQSNLIAGTVAIVTVVILLFISILLVSQVRSSITREYNDSGVLTGLWDADDNATWDSVVDNSNTAFTLLAIALIIMVAFMIIGILRGGG